MNSNLITEAISDDDLKQAIVEAFMCDVSSQLQVLDAEFDADTLINLMGQLLETETGTEFIELLLGCPMDEWLDTIDRPE